ncbi:hypothetical protein AMTR_s00051p00129510 [Amborella trichopoda]|uniref:Uncharacterized protein n=1 Tax=Amborella trichopoda TaxID=13333 RepID=U5CTQ2_AMBTC|nr:hypothetical protein AMTR_s00051p00129510 [Amborella trichopoda]
MGYEMGFLSSEQKCSEGIGELQRIVKGLEVAGDHEGAGSCRRSRRGTENRERAREKTVRWEKKVAAGSGEEYGGVGEGKSREQ